jgi:threonine dehydratase
LVELEDIRQARRRLRGVAARPPLVRCAGSGERRLYFKPESFQPVGSFKLRGAYNKVASLPPEVRERGVISYSSGNHAQGVAYAARELGVPAVIVMPENASLVKAERTAALGAEVVRVGNDSEERKLKAEELAAARGYTMVPPYDDPEIIAGQGTVGLEILEDLPEVTTVWAPVGGGGLLSGVAAAVKLSRPEVRVVGVEPELAADARESFYGGTLRSISGEQAGRTVADGLRTRSLGALNFEHVRRFVDDIVAVSEEEILAAMRRLAFGAKLVAEPSGAVAFAGYLSRPAGGPGVVVVSGGNVEPRLLARVLATTP